MRRSFGPQPYLFPMPVLIIGTYNEDGVPNAMNAAWGTIADMDRVAIFLADHKTTQNIFARKDFTVSPTDLPLKASGMTSISSSNMAVCAKKNCMTK